MRMRFRFFALAVVVLITAARPAGGATAEAQLNGAKEIFEDKFYDRAEQACVEFVQNFPTSPRLAEVLLLQARSRLEQSNYAGAMELLVANQNVLGQKRMSLFFGWERPGFERENIRKQAGCLK